MSAKGDREKFNNKSNNITFTENKGQVSDQFNRPRPDVLFSGEANGMVFHLRKDGVSYQLYKRISSERLTDSTAQPELGGIRESGNRGNTDSVIIQRIDINWIGANKDFEIEYGEATEDYNNYYLAVCPDGITRVNSYKDITFKNVWDGIDLKWYERNGELEVDFIIAPGGDVNAIKWQIEGTKNLAHENGMLIMNTPLGKIGEQRPLAFQGAKRIAVSRTLEGNEIGFRLGHYDKSKTVIIDPIIKLWGTYYGGNGNDRGFETVLDQNSNIYFMGTTESTNNIATTGAHQTNIVGLSNTFLVKFDSSGTRQWGTYFLEIANSVAVDGSMNVYIAGSTNLTSGIATAGAHQDSVNFYDAYLIKFNSSGQRSWGTYYGGFGVPHEEGNECFVDKQNNVYLVGASASLTNISTPGVHLDTLTGGAIGVSTVDGFLTKFNTNGTRIWGTYYGGSDLDWGYSGATNNSGDVYILGLTRSSNGIATTGAHQSTFTGGLEDGFVMKFDSTGNRYWGTYYGGPSEEDVTAMATDANGNVYFGGFTKSLSGIASSNGHQTINALGPSWLDGFLVKMDPNGNRLWATYYGGSENDYIYDIKTKTNGVFIAGWTNSDSNISTWNGHVTQIPNAVKGFICKFNDGGVRQWASYTSGAGGKAFSVAVNEVSGVYAGGYTIQGNLGTSGSHQSSHGGGFFDALLEKYRDCNFDNVEIWDNGCSPFISPSGNHTWTSNGTYYDTLVNYSGCDSILKIHLTINNNSSIQQDTSCILFNSPSGKYTWTQSGTYMDTVINSKGCDSIIQFDLTIKSVDINVSISGDRLKSQADNAVYQWIDCSTGSP
ncbi:MAG TPA: hypothetical protein DCX54_02670, partial [Flavobacteriales bacterium]|nr:hypothetical protein [Flavobacteriales bacterium]